MKCSKAILRQYAATFFCLLGSIMTSICFVWYAPLMVWLVSPNNKEIVGLDNDKLYWLVAVQELGELVGPFVGAYISDRWGRKKALLTLFPIVMSSFLIHALTRSITWLFVARVLQGLAAGVFWTAAGVYIAEISHPDIRGELCGYAQTMGYIGVIYAYSMGAFLSYQNYIYASTIPVILFIMTFTQMPESPYSLLMNSDIDGAEASLAWFRGDDNVAEELKSMVVAVEKDRLAVKGGWKELFTSETYRKPLIVMTVFGIVKLLGGTTTIQTTVTYMFSKGEGDLSANYISIIMGVILLVASFIAANLVDRWGRRPMVLWSTFLVAISSVILAAFFFVERETEYDSSGLEWISYSGLLIYGVGLNLALGPMQTALQAEYFPSNLRSAAGTYCISLRCFLLFISIKQYQVFDDYLGMYTNFMFYAVVAFVGYIVLYRIMEETARKPLDQIQNEIRGEDISTMKNEKVHP